MAVSTGNVSQRGEKTCKSIYTSAVVTRLDVFCLRGTLCHTVSVSREAGVFNQLYNWHIMHSDLYLSSNV